MNRLNEFEEKKVSAWQLGIEAELVRCFKHTLAIKINKLASLSEAEWTWTQSVLASESAIRIIKVFPDYDTPKNYVPEDVIDKLASLQASVNKGRSKADTPPFVVVFSSSCFSDPDRFTSSFQNCLKLFTIEKFEVSFKVLEEFSECLREILPKARINSIVISRAETEGHWTTLLDKIGPTIPFIGDFQSLVIRPDCCYVNATFDFISVALSNPSFSEVKISSMVANLYIVDRTITSRKASKQNKFLKLVVSHYYERYTGDEEIATKREVVLIAFARNFIIDSLQFDNNGLLNLKSSNFLHLWASFAAKDLVSLSLDGFLLSDLDLKDPVISGIESLRVTTSRKVYAFPMGNLKYLKKLEVSLEFYNAGLLLNDISSCKSLEYVHFNFVLGNSGRHIFSKLLIEVLKLPLISYTVHASRGNRPESMNTIWTQAVMEGIQNCTTLLHIDLQGLDKESFAELLKLLNDKSNLEQCFVEAHKQIGSTVKIKDMLLEVIAKNRSLTSLAIMNFQFFIRRSVFFKAFDLNKTLCLWDSEMEYSTHFRVLSTLQRNRRLLEYDIRLCLVHCLKNVRLKKNPLSSVLFDSNCLPIILEFLEIVKVLERFNKDWDRYE